MTLRNVLLVLALVFAGCDSPAQRQSAVEQRSSERIARDDAASITDGPMRVSVYRVAQEGWRGRLIVASITPRGRAIRVVPSERPQPLAAIVAPVGLARPFAAIDGGFYGTDGVPLGLVRTEGRDVHPLADAGGSGVFVIDEGRPRILARDAYRDRRNTTEAVQSIDRWVVDHRSVVAADASDRRAARSAVAITEDYAVHLAVAFDERAVAREDGGVIELGPASGQTGPTIGEFAALLARSTDDGGPIGALDALGLDGGFSTSLEVKSEVRSLRVVAHRATINAIAVSAAP